jgi:2-polyprenyl-3-methyl-5-hydroxy-6-metoxy-1,4-benzoquinol methylase
MADKADNTVQKMINEAEGLFSANSYEAALGLYSELTKNAVSAPLAYYRLACIANAADDPLLAKTFYYKAFDMEPDICGRILPKDHPNFSYVFKGLKKEDKIESCPLCGEAGKAKWCYSLNEYASAHVQQYNPVRVWMYCGVCHHMYAEEFPEQKIEVSKSGAVSAGRKTHTVFFKYYSEILTKIRQYTHGGTLLEIGIGGGECALAAQEMGFDVLGIDISEGNVRQAARYGLNAEHADFMDFCGDRKWDVIIMGDVLEHVSDPIAAMEKVRGSLADGGVLWLSTPNFDAAFSKVAGHGDPMRKEANHKNYFSRHSLFKLLDMFGVAPVEYSISAHYNGSMEVIAVREVAESV